VNTRIAGNAEQVPDAGLLETAKQEAPIFIRRLGLLDIVSASFDPLVTCKISGGTGSLALARRGLFRHSGTLATP